MADIVEFAKTIREHVSTNIKVALPGIIESYDYKTQKATIKIDIKEKLLDDSVIEYPVISGVPVIFPASGGASITLPVIRGDGCLVIFADRDISNWLNGGSNVVTNSNRLHALTDAIAIPGLGRFTSNSKAVDNESVLIQYGGSSLQLKSDGITDIVTGKEINVKTDKIVINCKSSEIHVEEDAIIESKNTIIKATENITIESADNILVESKGTKITSSESLDIISKNANITIEETGLINSKNINISLTEVLEINCKSANITATNDINAKCETFKVDGKLEVTGDSNLKGALTTDNGITNSAGNIVSGGVNLQDHSHTYIAEGGVPTQTTGTQ